MKRAFSALLLIATACVAGVACSELLYRWPTARELIARVFGRGELLAVVSGSAIYASDGEASELVIAANLRREAADEQISSEAINRELELLRYQFGDEKIFEAELAASGLSVADLRGQVAEHLRAQHWVEKQIASEIGTTAEESRAFYDTNPEALAQPLRFRVSHLFLAAPEATPPDVVQTKSDAINALSKRLSKGEDFAQLVSETSEDDATKEFGGDVRFFSAERMPADFMAAVQKLAPGKPSPPVRLALGFHILQLTDTRPARQMPFQEVRGEIGLHLANAKRAAAVERLRQRLTTAEFIRTRL